MFQMVVEKVFQIYLIIAWAYILQQFLLLRCFLFHSVNESFVTAFCHILYLGENNQNGSSKIDTNDKNVKNGNHNNNN